MALLKSKNKGKRVSVPAYSALSLFYDHIMDHVDYVGWAHYVMKLAQLHGQTAGLIIDMSCGTGTICRQIEKMGFSVLGCDASFPMLIQASGKDGRLSLNRQYICSDMRKLPVHVLADVVLSLYDSMNYLLSDKDWLRCMAEVYQILVPRGLFIFDVSTVSNSLQAFKDYHQQENLLIGKYVRQSKFHAKTMIQFNFFEIELCQNPGVIYFEQHRQRIRYLKEIEALIEATPFKKIACYSGFSLQPGNESAERVHLILQKE